MRVTWLPFIGLLLVLSLLSGCGNYARYRPYYAVAGSLPPHAQRPRYAIVLQGETLYSIAWRYRLDYRTVAGWNAISSPYTIYPGQHIRLTPPVTAPVLVRRVPARRPAPAPKRARHVPVPRAVVVRRGPLHWQWPTQGTIISSFSSAQVGRKGLDIAGKFGQPVYAAASGRVVYSGSGLRGYGKLIIINHNNTYLSAYAHNSRLLVRENAQVTRGQRIADMGDSGADRVMLYFEIRRNGKPVNPMKYLPRRH